jgi:predicted ribonuclease YlaK
MTKRQINDDECMFFGLDLTPEQKEFRDAIYGDDHDIIFCNAKAGTGKTTIAVATAKLLVANKNYKGLVYIINPVQEERQGYLPGDINEKTMPYAEPLIDALNKIGETEKSIRQLNPNIEAEKNGITWVDCISHTFLRGVNFENKIIIIDEAQNAYVDELQKILTRAHDSCKVIVIGHTGQKDIYKHPERSGFDMYIKHFEGKERCKICTLTKNFRGWVSTWADELNVEQILQTLATNPTVTKFSH